MEISLRDAAFLKTKLYASKMELYCREKIALLNQASITYVKYINNVWRYVYKYVYIKFQYI